MPKTEKKGKHSKKDKATKSSPRHEDTAKGHAKHEPGSTGKPDDNQHGSRGHDDGGDKGHKDDKSHGHDESGDKGHDHGDSGDTGDKGHGPKR